MSDEAKGVVVPIVVLLLLFVPGVVEIVGQARTERFCLEHGYPSADWRWFGDNYCIKRVDQTDVVTPTRLVK